MIRFKGGCSGPAVVLFFLINGFSFENTIFAEEMKKRDPFVALVHPNGKIKTTEELFPRVEVESLLAEVVLKAIIWDETRPLAMINNKIYTQGNEIVKGLSIEKINQNSVVLNDNGRLVTIQLRKIKDQ